VDNFIGNYMVPLFFIAGTVAMWFLAYKYLTAKGTTFKNFGTGLLLYGLGFGAWGIGVLTKDNVDFWTLVGVIPFAAAHLFYLMAATEKVKASVRSLLLFGAAAYLVVLFLIRTLVYESSPGFSDGGLFYFNAHPTVIMMYILAFALTLLPAIDVVSQKLKDKTLRVVSQVGFTILAVGGIILVSSYDDNLQTLNGWVMGATWIVVIAAYSTKRVK
jgi:hypothetical protein